MQSRIDVNFRTHEHFIFGLHVFSSVTYYCPPLFFEPGDSELGQNIEVWYIVLYSAKAPLV